MKPGGIVTKAAGDRNRLPRGGGRPQAAADAGLCASAKAPSSVGIRLAGFGVPSRKPCTWVQPSARTARSCSIVSTPSAVVAMPSVLPSPATARTIASDSGRLARSRMNDWSILILSNGNLRR